jgi:hypothetical protein
MKTVVFWVVAPCSLVEVYQHFRGPCCLHHQGDEKFLCTLLWEKYRNLTSILKNIVIILVRNYEKNCRPTSIRTSPQVGVTCFADHIFPAMHTKLENARWDNEMSQNQ